ncbi:MAG: hypothetical protein O2968_06500 [Acidobacteria bacterium]|nr:hypothetical protein [Acidobacteriota bacterium]
MKTDKEPQAKDGAATGDNAELTDEALDQSSGGATGETKTIIGGFKSVSGMDSETDTAGVTVRGWDPKQKKEIVGEAE